MELPGVVIDELVLDLLASPPTPTLTGMHNGQLCESVAELVRVQRGAQVALWRGLDEMVTREGSRRAVDITADWLHASSAFPLADARAMVVMGVRMCADPTVLEAFAAGAFGERESKFVVDFLAHPPKDMYTKPTPPAADADPAADSDGADPEAADPDAADPDAADPEVADPGVDEGVPMSDSEREIMRAQVLDVLLKAAEARDMRFLRVQGENLRDVLSKEIHPGDDIDRNKLDIADYGKGRVWVRGDFDTETGENLRSALESFMAPRPEPDGSPDRRSPGRIRADALSEFVRRSQPAEADSGSAGDGDSGSATDGAGDRARACDSEPVGDRAGAAAEGEDRACGADMPAAAGRGRAVRPRISIHIPIELLFGDIPTHAQICQMISDGRIEDVLELTGRGWLSRMGSVSLAAVKRLACDCEMTMIGADLHGAPLTVVTEQRYATKKHRIALEGRDKGCSFPNCDRPVDWTQAHHMIPWEVRHITQIDNLCLLCTAHHVAVHHQGWEVAMSGTRYPVFRPPSKVDPFRRWRDGNGNIVVDPPPPKVFFTDTA